MGEPAYTCHSRCPKDAPRPQLDVRRGRHDATPMFTSSHGLPCIYQPHVTHYIVLVPAPTVPATQSMVPLDWQPSPTASTSLGSPAKTDSVPQHSFSDSPLSGCSALMSTLDEVNAEMEAYWLREKVSNSAPRDHSSGPPTPTPLDGFGGNPHSRTQSLATPTVSDHTTSMARRQFDAAMAAFHPQYAYPTVPVYHVVRDITVRSSETRSRSIGSGRAKSVSMPWTIYASSARSLRSGRHSSDSAPKRPPFVRFRSGRTHPGNCRWTPRFGRAAPMWSITALFVVNALGLNCSVG
jgi:hypothetical protein